MALRIARLALDLLLPARQACLSQTLSWLPCFGDAPRWVDRLSIYDGAAVCSVLVDVAEALALYLALAQAPRGTNRSTGRTLWTLSAGRLADVHWIVKRLLSRVGCCWFDWGAQCQGSRLRAIQLRRHVVMRGAAEAAMARKFRLTGAGGGAWRREGG